MNMNMKMLQRAGMFFAAAVLLATPAHAKQDPAVLIESTVQIVLSELTDRREEFKADQKKLFAMIDRIVVPLFDTPRIGKLVMGSYWKQANAMQRADFTDEFKKLMVSSYSLALFDYTGKESVEFLGSEISERKKRKTAKVKSQVLLSSGPPVPVEYALLLGKDGNWRIYNLTIAGLNMITHYRAAYSASIDKLGLDGLIASMKEVNRKNSL